MVPKPEPAFPATSPQRVGALIEASLRLWLASARPALPASLLYALAGWLPGLAFIGQVEPLVTFALDSTKSLADPSRQPDIARAQALIDGLLEVLAAPSTWALIGLASVLALAATVPVLQAQWRLVQGRWGGSRAALAHGCARVPAGLVAWLLFLLAMGLSLLPLAGFVVLMFLLAQGLSLGVGGLLLWALGFFLGGLLASVPLCWISVAGSFAPFLAAGPGASPPGALRDSVRLVRGHWVHAALVTGVPFLLYLGIGSTVSSTLTSLCASLALSLGGWDALRQGTWLAWSQALALLPMALLLPLAFAGGTVCLHDLRLRAATAPTRPG